MAGVSLEDHRDRRHPVSGLRGEDETERALPGAAMRGDSRAMRRMPLPDAVLDGNGPVRPKGPFYGPLASSSESFLPQGYLDLLTYRSIRRKEHLPTRPSSRNP